MGWDLRYRLGHASLLVYPKKRISLFVLWLSCLYIGHLSFCHHFVLHFVTMLSKYLCFNDQVHYFIETSSSRRMALVTGHTHLEVSLYSRTTMMIYSHSHPQTFPCRTRGSARKRYKAFSWCSTSSVLPTLMPDHIPAAGGMFAENPLSFDKEAR